MNILKANTNKPWMSDEYDMPVLENEEMWSQRIIDDVVKDLFDEIEQDENNVNKKEKD
jgi:hypothetical protein